MTAIMTVLAGAFGLAVGSFLNVCIDRLPRGESIATGRSHCDGCSRQLSARELVPVISYLVRKGRCSSCGAQIPRRVPFVETATGLAFAGMYYAYGPTGTFLLLAAYATILIVVFVIDLEHGLILNKVVVPALALALAVATIVPPQWLGTIGPHPIVSALIGAGTGFLFLFLVALASRGGMGWGDVKFAAFMGAATGFPLIMVALFGGVVIGGVTGIVLLVLRRKGRKETIPFGPFLAVGTMIALLWGQTILRWYIGML